MSLHGFRSYLTVSAAIARSEGKARSLVLTRILTAKAVSGLSAFEYGLYGLQNKSIREIRAYRTKKQTSALFDCVNPLPSRSTVDDKLLFHDRCLQTSLPTPNILAVISSRRKPGDDGRVVREFSHLLAMLKGQNRIDLILKPRTDSLGTGVRFVSFRQGRIYDLEGKEIDAAAFTAELSEDMRRDEYLVQPFVRPHPEIARLGAGRALGTLRILTFNDAGSTSVLYALMRIPASGNVHDNFSSGANGNLIAAIDSATGRLSAAWGRRSDESSRLLGCYPRNPDTGAQIEGSLIPMWDQVTRILPIAAQEFQELPCIGWDFAVSEDGVRIIEANANPDIIGAQVCCGVGANVLLAPIVARYQRCI